MSLKWWVLSEEKHWLKIGREMHSNIKYSCGWGAVGIAWARFQLVDSISDIKKREGSITSFKLIGID